MRKIAAIGALLITACCVRPSQPPPEQTATVAPPPAPAPPPVTLGPDWRDWPLTPGDWRYVAAPGGSVASYGRAGAAPDLALRCDAALRQVTISLASSAAAPGPLVIRTTSADRTLTASAAQPGVAEAALAANDGTLDAMAFSRGRFLVSLGGAPNVVAPAWPEVSRVIEDCRS